MAPHSPRSPRFIPPLGNDKSRHATPIRWPDLAEHTPADSRERYRIGFRCSLCPRWAILQDRISPPTSASDVACDMTSRLRGSRLGPSWPGQARPIPSAPHAPSPAPAGSGETSRCAPGALAGHRFRWSRQARCSLRQQHPDPETQATIAPAAASRRSSRPAAAVRRRPRRTRRPWPVDDAEVWPRRLARVAGRPFAAGFALGGTTPRISSTETPSDFARAGSTSPRGGVPFNSQNAMLETATPTAAASSVWVSPACCRNSTRR